MRAAVACSTVIGHPEESSVTTYVYDINEIPEFEQLSAADMDQYRSEDAGWIADHSDYS